LLRFVDWRWRAALEAGSWWEQKHLRLKAGVVAERTRRLRVVRGLQ
jgi:hypothetical protein